MPLIKPYLKKTDQIDKDNIQEFDHFETEFSLAKGKLRHFGGGEKNY